METTINEKRNFRVSEFSKVFGICRSLVYREIKQGRLKMFKVGGVTLISREAAEEWQSDREKGI